MPDKNTNPSDVLQAHSHSQLSAEQIAKAVARHARDHKGDAQQAAQAKAKAKKGK
jgi:hypothetical protein